MQKHIATLLLSLFLLTSAVFAEEMTLEAAWEKIKTYRYGDDFKPLLMVENDVQRSTASPEMKAKTAARLAGLLNDNTSYPGRQFVCMQLRLVGGAAEVPKLAEYLNKPQDAENARMALEDIRCDESLVPLRKALEMFEGEPLVGVIGSLATRQDKTSIPALVKRLGSPDKTVVAAAASALGTFGMDGIDALKKAKGSLSGVVVGSALIEAASDLAKQGKTDEAKKLYELSTETAMPRGIRRAGFEGLLRLLPEEQRKETVVRWFFDKDDEKNTIAASRLSGLSTEQFDGLLEKVDTMSGKTRIAFYEIAAEREGPKLLEALLQSLKSADAVERLTALRSLGKLRDVSTISVFVDALVSPETTVREAAKSALMRFPRENVGPALIGAFVNDAVRNAAIDVLVDMKYYDAIDPMLRLARIEDEKIWSPAVDGLARLCDPDEHDLPRMLQLYLDSRTGVHRERIERAVVTVCEKLPDIDVRGDKLLEQLGKRDGGLSDTLLVQTLPLLGKVGNPRIAELVREKIDSNDPALRQSAVRAFCNWPNADYHADLWKIVAENPSPQYRQWALRAFVRVVTLKSDRPAEETLAMLQKAFKAADADADRQWALSRAATVRTLPSAEWAASFLDDSGLAQTACAVIVELAHHRFLREPNKAKFEPMLLKVEQLAKDKSVAERAKKSRLGM